MLNSSGADLLWIPSSSDPPQHGARGAGGRGRRARRARGLEALLRLAELAPGSPSTPEPMKFTVLPPTAPPRGGRARSCPCPWALSSAANDQSGRLTPRATRAPAPRRSAWYGWSCAPRWTMSPGRRPGVQRTGDRVERVARYLARCSQASPNQAPECASSGGAASCVSSAPRRQATRAPSLRVEERGERDERDDDRPTTLRSWSMGIRYGGRRARGDGEASGANQGGG